MEGPINLPAGDGITLFPGGQYPVDVSQNHLTDPSAEVISVAGHRYPEERYDAPTASRRGSRSGLSLHIHPFAGPGS